jgi:hypothetical protein
VTLAFPVRDITYSGDALRGRLDDLTAALGHGTTAAVSAATWAQGGVHRAILAARVRRLVSEIARVRDAVESVLHTVPTTESARVTTLEGAICAVAPALLFGPVSVLATAWTGELWATLRPLFTYAREFAPQRPATRDDVSVTALPPSTSHPPRTLRDRIARIPRGDTHIHIERFDSSEGYRFEVFLSGTNFSGGPDDPWNASSNIDLAVTGSSPALQAVRSAMDAAGVTRHTPVVLTGHSQGGLIALALAESGDFTVDAVITVGTPVGVVPDATTIPTVHIVHPEDPIPVLGGVIERESSTWVVPVSNGERWFDAHHRESYLPSAAALDAIEDPRLTALRATIQSTGSGVARDYRAITLGDPP